MRLDQQVVTVSIGVTSAASTVIVRMPLSMFVLLSVGSLTSGRVIWTLPNAPHQQVLVASIGVTSAASTVIVRMSSLMVSSPFCFGSVTASGEVDCCRMPRISRRAGFHGRDVRVVYGD